MMPHDSSPFFSPPPLPSNDHPLSASGRFGRLSAIAWYCFIHLITLFASIALSLALGLLNLQQWSMTHLSLNTLSSMTGLGFSVIFLLYLYFLWVITIRRLHDMNRSGWFSLFFLLPILNVLLSLYLLFGSGSTGSNRYGAARVTAIWEKILAWLMIILTLLSFIVSGSLMSYQFQSGEINTPQQVIEKGTAYF